MNTTTIRTELHHATVVAAAVACWILAASLVLWIGARLDASWPAWSLAGKMGAILLVSFVYMRLAGRKATFEHALFTGISWAAMSIIAEMAVAVSINHNWHPLLGTVDGWFRNLLLVAWIAAPALFARRRS